MLIVDLFIGLAYPFRGARILQKYRLRRYWIWPIVITFGALCSAFYLAVRFREPLTALIWPEPIGQGTLGTVLHALHTFVEGLLVVLMSLAAVVVCALTSNVVAAPFNDALSEAVERLETGHPAPPFSLVRMAKDLHRTVRLEVSKLVLYVVVMFPTWVLSFLMPGFGPLLYLVLGTLFTSAYFAIDYVDWPASRRGLGVRDRVHLFAKRPGLMLGFGFGLSILLFVPLLNLFLMPIAVAAGTRLFLDVEHAERSPD